MRINYLKILLVLFITAFVIWLLSGIYIVQTNEEAVVQHLGRLVRDKVPPGIHYHLPLPFETATRIQVRKTERITVGVKSTVNTPDTVIIRRISGDVNIINVIATLQYSIKEAANYLFKVNNPITVLRNASEAAITQVFGSIGVDYALTIGKTDVQNKIRELTQRFMDEYGTGILILNVNLKEVSPPKAVEQAFIDVINAQSDAQRYVNEASGYRNTTVLNAEAKSNEIKSAAETYYQEKINRAKGETDRFLNVLSEYRISPDINRNRMYIETIEDIAPRVKKIIISEVLDTSLIKIYGIDKESKVFLPKVP